MNLIKADKENIIKAANVIKQGGLVAFPTETVYGLGADGLNPIAAAKIFEAKERPAFNPLILHIADKEWLPKLTNYNNVKIDKLINHFWPGPLTIVLPKTDMVPDIVTSGNPTVAVRMPDHKIALDFIKESGTPIAAPSANKFGQLSPTDANHVVKSLGNKVDLILDGGKTSVGVESTILELADDEIFLLRPGGISKEEIENVIGEIQIGVPDENKPTAPGQLPFHYAPSIPLAFLNKENTDEHKGSKVGALYFENIKEKNPNWICKVLSERGDMKEAAANLFRYLHEFEKENIEIILVEPVEEVGLGVAIMDRLRKASAKY